MLTSLLIFILNKSKSANSMETLCFIPYCLVVRIPGSHPGGPGSIRGVGSSSNLKCILLLQTIFGVLLQPLVQGSVFFRLLLLIEK